MVDRATFLGVWGHKLDPEQVAVCDENSTFLLCKDGGFALKFKRKMCMVVMAAGNGIDIFRELVAAMKIHGITSIVFYFKKNSPASAFAKYVKARHWVSRDKYDNGEPAHLAMVRLNCKRLRRG